MTTKIYKVSPKGIAVFPKLTQEDVYNGSPAGYKVELRMDAEVALEAFGPDQERLEAFVEKTKKGMEPPKAKKLITNDLLIDNEDGTMSVKFSSKYKPVFYDAKGNLLEDAPEIWGGSVLKVAYGIDEPYNSSGKVGIKLQMNSVQIISLVTGGAGGNPFGAAEDEDAPASPFAAVDDEVPFEGGTKVKAKAASKKFEY